MRVVVALGGNALLRRGEPALAENQRRNAAGAARAIAGVVGAHDVVVTHGNGPQVGLLQDQARALPGAPDALDVLGAESEGMIGYWLEQELRNELAGREVATLLTQTVVDEADPAFARPTKPIGTVVDREAADALEHRGHAVVRDGAGWRRAVASPAPREILELEAIQILHNAGVVVICGGGGGIPVVRDASGVLRGVEAVVDKDHASALLAQALGADALLLLTDVDGVYEGWPGQQASRIASMAPEDPRRFDAGSMGPKVDAARRFAASGPGRRAAIGRLEDAERLLEGSCGTQVRTDGGTQVRTDGSAPGRAAGGV